MVGPLLRGALLALALAACKAQDGGEDVDGGAEDLTAEQDQARPPAPDLPPGAPDLVARSCTSDAVCGAGERCCLGFCRSYTDPNHCGACGLSCGPAAGAACCGVGEGAICVNTLTDAAHCGGCGGVCPMATRPSNGRPFQLSCCSGTCSNPYSDNQNCTACGMQCTGTPQCCDHRELGPGCRC